MVPALQDWLQHMAGELHAVPRDRQHDGVPGGGGRTAPHS